MADTSTSHPSSSHLKIYHGNCHCGAFKFRLTIPPLGSKPLHACRCSICAKKGTLFVLTDPSNVTLEKGAGKDGLGKGILKDYSFNSMQLLHRFCPTCGNAFGIVRADGTGVVCINTRLLRDVDLGSLEVYLDDGPVTPLPFSVPGDDTAFAGLQRQVGDGEKVYHGSCHCKAVSFAMRAKPMDDEEAFEVKECDCSICIREGCVLTYPVPRSRVVIKQNPPGVLTSYFPQTRKFTSYQFCSICGVLVSLDVVGPPAEWVATKPPHVQEKIKEIRDIQPLNVKAMNFFLGISEDDRNEWDRIKGKVVKERGSQEGEAYQVPE